MDQQLIYAAQNDNLPEVKRLVAAGANPAVQNNAAIILASEHGHLNIVQYLVTLPGANPAAQDNGAIVGAAKHGHLNVVQYLVTLPGVDPGARNNLAIILAAEHGHLNVVQYLVTLPGVDAAAPNNNAIILALGGGYWDIVRFLASLQGFDPQGDNYDLFIWAISKGLINIVNHLGYRLPVYIYNNHALVVAAQNGNLEMVRFLMEQPGVDDKDGTASYAAKKNGYDRVVELLMTLPKVAKVYQYHEEMEEVD